MADVDAGLVVRDVTVRAVVVPLGRPLATKVGDFSQWPLLLIDVTTEQGITGRGYLAPYLTRATTGLRTILSDLGATLRGQPVSPAAAYASARGWLGLAGYQGLALAAVAGLDIALWDALAQAAGLPLAVLLGGTMAPLPAYNSNGLGLIPPGKVADEALELLAEGGFTALKVRVGRARAADDIAAVRRVRAAVGDDVTLVADYNQGLGLGEALERCRALDGEGLTWIEEPLRYDDLDGHARLAAGLATPVMLGENFYGPRAMHDAIRARACDLVMPDLMRIGGVTGWLQAAAIADVTGLPMSSHLYPEVSGHLLRVTPTRHWLEWQDWAHPVLARPFEVRAGELHLPDVPGNGLAWDEDAVAHYQADRVRRTDGSLLDTADRGCGIIGSNQARQGGLMIFITAKFKIRPEDADQWPEISADFTEATRNEPGCLWFDWSRSLADPQEYILIEAFRDGEAGGAHVQSDHFKKAQQSLPPHLAQTPRIVNVTIPQDDWSLLGEMAVPGPD